jgi:uncharacterized membrane-anchored protein
MRGFMARVSAMLVFIVVFLVLDFIGAKVMESMPGYAQIAGMVLCAVIAFLAARFSYQLAVEDRDAS